MPSLYLVPTPIGNLSDMTYRAVQVLNDVDFILAEDTRTSGVLLKHYDISKPLSSFHTHNEHKILNSVLERLKNGETAALISDAGTPGISDPGYLLVRECLKNDVQIECLPGPTALIPALVKSGFPTDRFVFEGFLPHKKGRQKRLAAIANEDKTVILYESPHRLMKLLDEIISLMGPDRYISVSRELTKLYEETITGMAEEVKGHFESGTVKGEFVIIIAGHGFEK